jgi:hypothetical protein
MNIAEENWIFGEYDGVPHTTFEPLIEHLSETVKNDIKLNC